MSSNSYSVSASSSLALQTQAPTVPSSWQAVTGTGRGELQAAALESAPAQQPDKKNPSSKCHTGGVGGAKPGWHTSDAPRPLSIIFPVDCFTVNTKNKYAEDVHRVTGRLPAPVICSGLFWISEPAQNEKDGARQPHCCRCCWKAQRMLICCEKSLSQNAQPSIYISKHLFPWPKYAVCLILHQQRTEKQKKKSPKMSETAKMTAAMETCGSVLQTTFCMYR